MSTVDWITSLSKLLASLYSTTYTYGLWGCVSYYYQNSGCIWTTIQGSTYSSTIYEGHFTDSSWVIMRASHTFITVLNASVPIMNSLPQVGHVWSGGRRKKFGRQSETERTTTITGSRYKYQMLTVTVRGTIHNGEGTIKKVAPSPPPNTRHRSSEGLNAAQRGR